MILKTKDLYEKSIDDLNEELAKLRQSLFESKMNFHSRKLENYSSMKELRKSIARILTVLKQRENGDEEAEA